MELLTKLVDWWVLTMTADNIGKWGLGVVALVAAINTALNTLSKIGPPSWRTASSKEMAENTVATNQTALKMTQTADTVEEIKSATKDNDLKATVAVQTAKRADDRSIVAETHAVAADKRATEVEKSHVKAVAVVIEKLGEVTQASKEGAVAMNGVLEKRVAESHEAGIVKGKAKAMEEFAAEHGRQLDDHSKRITKIETVLNRIEDRLITTINSRDQTKLGEPICETK